TFHQPHARGGLDAAHPELADIDQLAAEVDERGLAAGDDPLLDDIAIIRLVESNFRRHGLGRLPAGAQLEISHPLRPQSIAEVAPDVDESSEFLEVGRVLERLGIDRFEDTAAAGVDRCEPGGEEGAESGACGPPGAAIVE